MTCLILVFGCFEEQPEQGIETGPIQPHVIEQPPVQEQLPKQAVYENLSDCMQLINPSEKDQCFSRVARQNIDTDACAHVVKDSMRSDCWQALAIATTNPSLCSENSITLLANSCYKNTALELGNLQGCDFISEPSLVADCYLKIAVKKQDESICEQIKNQIYKDKCHSDI